MSEILVKNVYVHADGMLTSRYGSIVWTPGEWVTHTDPVSLCEVGLHANHGPTLGDAFRAACQYVYPAQVWRPEVEGEVNRDRDKLVCRRMRLVERIDRAEAFRAAWPQGDAARLDDVDRVIGQARKWDRRAQRGGRDAADVVAAFAPWRNTAFADTFAATYAAFAATYDAYDAALADAADAAAAAYDAALAAADAARYYFAQAVVPHDARVRHPNPFAVLLAHYAEGGTREDVMKAWNSSRASAAEGARP